MKIKEKPNIETYNIHKLQFTAKLLRFVKDHNLWRYVSSLQHIYDIGTSYHYPNIAFIRLFNYNNDLYEKYESEWKTFFANEYEELNKKYISKLDLSTFLDVIMQAYLKH